jgi:hypothetical protein
MEASNPRKKIQFVASMTINLLVPAEAEKSAVMADTDEASHAFAEQSTQASTAVEEARREFARLVEGSKAGEEMSLFREFGTCREKFQGIDGEVFSLAMQNTNLKALRLSFVPAASAIKQMEASMNQLPGSVASSPDAAKIILLSSEALTDALNIYMLEAPRIAWTTEARMDEIEARKSCQEFPSINREIINLSRQNSNARSFALPPGQKRNTMAQCLDSLNALQEAVQESANSKASR